MAFLDETGATEFWAKCKAWFGRALGINTASTTVDVLLKNNAGDTLSTGTLPAATDSKAGVMTAAEHTKLAGVATGATANTGTITGISSTSPIVGSGTSGSVSLSHAASGPSSSGSTSKGDTTAQTPGFGGSFKVTSETVDKYGHTTALAEHNVTIPSSEASASAAGLMSAADKAKLDGVAAGANAYTHPAYDAASAALAKVGRDATGHVVLGAAITKSDITALGIPAQDTTYDDFTGSTESAAGAHGLVPAPAASRGRAALLGDGGWHLLSGVVSPSNSSPYRTNIYLKGDFNDAVADSMVTWQLNPATSSLPGTMTPAQYTKLSGIEAGAQVNPSFAASQGLGVSESSGTLTYKGQKIYHAVCETAASTTAKVATLVEASDYALEVGVMVAVTFKYGNSATTPTLKVTNGSDAAKTIAIPKDATAYQTGNGTTYNSWGAYETVFFTYNGTYWVNMGSGRLAYLAYNKANSISVPTAYTSNPAMDGTASPGSSSNWAKGDHVHPTDTSRAPLASPALTGTPTAPTAQDGTNTTQIATTAFVHTAVSNAQSGAATFQGTLSSQSTLTSADYKSGWYWVVSAAGTYAGQECESGDMVYAIADKDGSYSADDFSVVQANIRAMTVAEVDAICV